MSSGSSLTSLVGANPPPADELDVRRVEFHPGEIRVLVRNPQPEDITIASVTVDDAIVPFTLDGPRTLGRLRSTTIEIPFDWVEDDPYTVGVTSSSGIQTVAEVPAAVETPGASGSQRRRLRPHRVARGGGAGGARDAVAARPARRPTRAGWPPSWP